MRVSMADARDPAILPRILVKYVTWAKVAAAVDSLLPSTIENEDRRNYIARLAPNDINNIPKQYEVLVDHLVKKGWLEDFISALFNQAQGNLVLRQVLQGTVPVDSDGNVSPDALQSIKNATEPFLKSQNFFEGMEAARYRVCAVWVDERPDGGKAEIKGTGFLVAPDIVITARHVVEALLGGPLDGPAVAIPGSEARLAFVFDYWTQTSNFKIDAPPPGATIVRPAATWLEWSSQRHPGDGRTHVFGGPPKIEECFDCAVIRLARHIGATVAGRSGSRMRGWQRLNGGTPSLSDGCAIAILQHAGGGPQLFDKGDYRADDPSHTRIWYETEAAQGSSGSPCFDSAPELIGFHNAGRPTQFRGDFDTCNQGVRMDHVIQAMPAPLVQESSKGLTQSTALWSLSDDRSAPEPVLGRADFKQAVVDLFGLHPAKRVIVVEDAPEVAAVGKSGKSFSARILKALARGRAGFVVEFTGKELRTMAPEQFLVELGRRIGLTALDSYPPKPDEERQLARWWAVELPQWFGQLVEARAKTAGTIVLDAPVAPGEGSALGREPLLRELIWIVIEDIHLDPPEGGMKEVIAGMMALTDTASLVVPGLKSLRWLVIGRIPDFVRVQPMPYLHDVVSQRGMGQREWVDCMATAYVSEGKEQSFNPGAAQAMYTISLRQMPGIKQDATMLKALSTALVNAFQSMPQGEGE